jgi:predicted transcriptional regulator
MAYAFPPDLDRLIKSQMATGDCVTEEDLLRDAISALAERQAIVADIRQGIDDLQAGLGRPLSEIDAEFRKKYNIAQDA